MDPTLANAATRPPQQPEGVYIKSDDVARAAVSPSSDGDESATLIRDPNPSAVDCSVLDAAAPPMPPPPASHVAQVAMGASGVGEPADRPPTRTPSLMEMLRERDRELMAQIGERQRRLMEQQAEAAATANLYGQQMRRLMGADGSNGSAAAALLPFLQGGGAGGDTTSSTGDMHNLMQAAALAAANQFGGNMLMTPNGGGGQPAALKRPGKGSDFEMYMNASASTSAAAAAAALPKPAGNKSGLKRKLFDGDKEAMKAAAASITREERIDLDDLEAFAQQFKKQRIKFGFTQGDVGTALGRRYGTDFSQTTISRFEALNLSFKNMCKLRPLLKEWLSDAEAALAGGATLNDLLERGTPRQNNYPGLDPALMPVVNSGVAAAAQAVGAPLKKRRKRTNLDMTQRTALDAYFRLNSRPDHDKMNEISELLELDRDVVRVWFCNRRQKMRKVEDTGSEARVDSAMLDQLFGGGGGGGGSRSSQPGSAASSTSATPVPPRSDSPGGGGEEQPQPVQVALGLGLAGLGGVGGLAGAAAAAGNILKDE